MGQRLHRLLYHSQAAFPDDPELVGIILRNILFVSRMRNEGSSIAGALMLSAGCFGQVLEGPEDALSDTFARIRNDDRHERVTLLTLEPIVERKFVRWSMGYVGLDPVEAAKSGASFDPSKAGSAELLQMLATLASDASIATAVRLFNPV